MWPLVMLLLVGLPPLQTTNMRGPNPIAIGQSQQPTATLQQPQSQPLPQPADGTRGVFLQEASRLHSTLSGPPSPDIAATAMQLLRSALLFHGRRTSSTLDVQHSHTRKR